MRIILFGLALLVLTNSAVSQITNAFINVKALPYAAKGDGVTDDTAAIQAALTAIETAGSGVVFFPNGVYIIGGALQDTSWSNSQLILPKIISTAGQISIKLVGEFPPLQTMSPSGSIVTPTYGSILKSTLSSGNGSLLGVRTSNGVQNISFIDVSIENMGFRMVANPSNSCLDLGNVPTIKLNNVVVDTGQYVCTSVTQPTTITSYGIIPPRNANAEISILNHVNVIGFCSGVMWNELLYAESLSLWACTVGARVPQATHPSFGNRVLMLLCPTPIKITGDHYLRINQLDIEQSYSTNWYGRVYDIDDASNLGHGVIEWRTVKTGVGTDHDFTLNGGTNLLTRELGGNTSAIQLFGTNQLSYAGTNLYWNGVKLNP